MTVDHEVQLDSTENEQQDDTTLGVPACEEKGEKEKETDRQEGKEKGETKESKNPKEKKTTSKKTTSKKVVAKIASANKARKARIATWYDFLGNQTACETELPYKVVLRGFLFNSRMITLGRSNSKWSKWQRWTLAYWIMILWTALTKTCAYTVAHWAVHDLHDTVQDDTWQEATALCPKRMYRDVGDNSQDDMDITVEQEFTSPVPGIFILMNIGFQTCIILGMIVFHTYSSRATDKMMVDLIRILPSRDPILEGATSMQRDPEAGIETADNNFRV